MAKILVTGGAGFIGSNLVDALIAGGNEVSVIDNFMTGNKKNVNSKAKLIVKDIRDDLNGLFSEGKFDYVYHLAAQANVRKSLENPVEDAKINIIGSLNLIDNCVKYDVKKFIFSSTGGAIYSKTARVPCNEESEIKPESPYGLAKWTVENYLRIMKDTKKLNYCILRYSNVYGPRQDAKGEAGVVSIFIDKLIKNEDLVVFGDGEQTRDFVFVKDVVNANLLAMKNNLEGVFNVGTEKEISVNELAKMLLKLTNKKVKVIHGPAIKGELLRNALNAGKLAGKGWKADYKLENGLKETVEWFTQQK
ncbi:MAG: NAD-dependent epimerase/dehydratase family protein [Nanoarchaeota archaeon]|nr:NAD-dependent epimerase/dehydratase family protein [Nanoarchaeota archaeon]